MASTAHKPTLRAYCSEDTAALHEIDREFQREVGFGTDDKPFYHHEDLEDVEGVYLASGGNFWVLEDAGVVAAYGAVLRVDDGTARLRRFRVRTAWRRRGLATRLLREAEAFCADRGYRRITLGTTDLQQAAQALYRKHGYVEIGERWLEPDLREIEFEKVLP